MRYVRHFGCVIGIAALSWSSAASAADRTFRNEEYAFRIAVPQGHPVCATKSGGHPHGFFYNIDAEPACDPDATGTKSSAIHIWRDHNAPFYTTAREARQTCQLSPYGQQLRGELKSGIRSWISCVTYGKQNKVDVSLTVLAGSNPQSWGEEAVKPCMIYDMFLTTYRHRLARDMRQFRKFIRNVRLYPGRCTD